MNDQPWTEDLDLQGVHTREDLAVLLRKLHARADSPALRVLAAWAIKHSKPSLAKATISDMLSAKRLAKKGTMLAFVEACGIPADELTPWRHAWERVASNEHDRPSLDAELDRVKQGAQARADAVLRQAEEDASKLHLEAQAEIGRLTGEAEARAEALLQRAQEHADEVDDRCRRLLEEARLRADAEARVLLEEARREGEDEAAKFRLQEEVRVQQHIEALREKAEIEARQTAENFVAYLEQWHKEGRVDVGAYVLALAQRTADQAIADARREADDTRARARRDAAELLSAARRKAKAVIVEP